MIGSFADSRGSRFSTLVALAIWSKFPVLSDRRGHANDIQTSTCRTWPGICGGGITFDLSLPATIASSHHYPHGEPSKKKNQRGLTPSLTLESFVSVMFVDEYIV